MPKLGVEIIRVNMKLFLYILICLIIIALAGVGLHVCLIKIHVDFLSRGAVIALMGAILILALNQTRKQ